MNMMQEQPVEKTSKFAPAEGWSKEANKILNKENKEVKVRIENTGNVQKGSDRPPWIDHMINAIVDATGNNPDKFFKKGSMGGRNGTQNNYGSNNSRNFQQNGAQEVSSPRGCL